MGLFRVPVTIAQTINVTIVSSATLNVDIIAQTVGNLNINIAASAITLSIDIVAQSVGNITVNIAASAINVPIDITAQTIGNVSVNIAASITINTAIVASSVTINTAIVAASVTLNISVVAQTINIDIDWAEQTIAVRPEQIFETFAGNDIDVSGTATVNASLETNMITHTVPAGKILYIYNIGFAAFATPLNNPTRIEMDMRVNNATAATTPLRSGGSPGGNIALTKPIVVLANEQVLIKGRHNDNVTGGAGRTLGASFHGVEV